MTPHDVVDAVEVGGRRCTGRFIELNSYENRVYQLELEDRSMVVGKFYRPGRWSREAILEEHAFLAELEAEEIPAVTPLELRPGESIGHVGGILYALFPRVGGRAPQELTDEQVEILGRLVARIHNVGSMRPARARPRLDPSTYAR
ncbi:MAG: phosphotransferase, partial [Polyangiaceae bacterium]|nr:phosphotransferase [Polyangiaceae bacterium]